MFDFLDEQQKNHWISLCEEVRRCRRKSDVDALGFVVNSHPTLKKSRACNKKIALPSKVHETAVYTWNTSGA